MRTTALLALLLAACVPEHEDGPPPCDCEGRTLVCNPTSDRCYCEGAVPDGATAARVPGFACDGAYRQYPACADLGCEDADLCENGADTCLCYVAADDHAYRCEP